MSVACQLFVAAVLFACLPHGSARCLEGTSSLQLVKENHYDLLGKTVVITGGDEGIGLGISTALAEAKARVIFLAHDMEKTAKVMKHLTAVTGNRHLTAIPTNLLSLVSVKQAVAEILDHFDHIDMVIGDAGATSISPFLTKDAGFADDFYLMYLSHFYLVELLLPKLRESHGRVIYTAGIAEPFGPDFCTPIGLDMGCESLVAIDREMHRINAVNPMAGTIVAYALKSIHARAISLREKNVMAFSFNPGAVFTPGIRTMMTKENEAAMCAAMPYSQCLCGTNVSCPLNVDQGAASAVYLAGGSTKELEKMNGEEIIQCGSQAPYDPFVSIQKNRGNDFALAYLKQAQVFSWAWVKSTGVLNAASAATDSGFTASGAFAIVFMIGVSFGVVVVLAKASTVASAKPESYIRLDSTL